VSGEVLDYLYYLKKNTYIKIIESSLHEDLADMEEDFLFNQEKIYQTFRSSPLHVALSPNKPPKASSSRLPITPKNQDDLPPSKSSSSSSSPSTTEVQDSSNNKSSHPATRVHNSFNDESEESSDGDSTDEGGNVEEEMGETVSTPYQSSSCGSDEPMEEETDVEVVKRDLGKQKVVDFSSDKKSLRRRVVSKSVVESSSSHEDSSEDEEQRGLKPWAKTKKTRLVETLISKVCIYLKYLFFYISDLYMCLL
jgi:hypothetical protein